MKKMLSFIFAIILVAGMPFSAFAQAKNLFVFTDEDTKTVTTIFEKNYSNKLVVLPTWSLSKQSESIKITAKIDLTDFDTSKLVFYNYNKIDNKLTSIEKPAASTDAKGNLTFTTNSNQGFVVVSNDSLALKETTTTTTKSTSNTVYWVADGKVYHTSKNCSTLKRSTNIKSGTISECGKKSACKVCS